MTDMYQVAICSRDSEENYEWLKDFLEKRMCEKSYMKVHPVYITNNTSQFQKEVLSGNDFAILYHTKKRGRINLTNVTDSLYDEELRFLCGAFGKNKVVVVIDDLENGDDHEKDTIIKEQGDLSKHACELFLFTEQDKNYTEKPLNIAGNRTMEEKMRCLKNCITQAKSTKPSSVSPKQGKRKRFTLCCISKA